jgi:hypothetical protein
MIDFKIFIFLSDNTLLTPFAAGLSALLALYLVEV